MFMGRLREQQKEKEKGKRSKSEEKKMFGEGTKDGLIKFLPV
jgi:hypothetical protein